MDIDRKKVRSDVTEDRSSALPDELIHQILYHCGTKFSVQTCVLSSRWKLIWKSVPHLDFSNNYKYSRKISKFVTSVLTHRIAQVEVSSVKLKFHGKASQLFVKKIADYAFSHNIQKLSVISCTKSCDVYPPCLFSSQTLKQLSLGSQLYSFCITPITPWDFPALTTLHLFSTMLCVDENKSFDLFSKCLNLEKLVIEACTISAKVFNINTPRLSTFKLIDCGDDLHGVINVIAPLLENITVVNSSINNIKAHGLKSISF